MKKKSSIKSIVVSRRDMVLTEGTIVYTCDAFGSKTLVIIGPVERLAHNLGGSVLAVCLKSEYDFYIGREEHLYLGDLGVPGHKYDNRPCSLFTSSLSAAAHKGKYWGWLETAKRNNGFDLYDPFDHDFYD
ncbi:hypothetical protein [Pseudomonas helleri]|uniref:hypothetical protein n=1 Tax=Pseudomonas helleri TaxID=1608996 RepID=UPI00242D2C30|nr:hypothetical protein [Pseudomonas helleri]